MITKTKYSRGYREEWVSYDNGSSWTMISQVKVN